MYLLTCTPDRSNSSIGRLGRVERPPGNLRGRVSANRVSKTEVSRIPMSCLRRTASHNHITTTTTPPPQHTITSHQVRGYFFLVIVYSRLGPWTRPLHPAHLTATTTTTKPCVSVELCVDCSKETTSWTRSSYFVLERPPPVPVVGALHIDCYPSRVPSTKTIKLSLIHI